MIRRIVSMLFEEEEITEDFEENVTEEAIEIPAISVIKAKDKEKMVATESKAVQSPEAQTNINPDVKKKSLMISIDEAEQKQVAKKVMNPEVAEPKKVTAYQPQDIISPIFGGPKVASKPLETRKPESSKSRRPLTEIISPMYGRVEIENARETISPDLMNLDLVDILSSRPSKGEEVQASLYELLDGFEDEK